MDSMWVRDERKERGEAGTESRASKRGERKKIEQKGIERRLKAEVGPQDA